jgi:opacity protein-like surface antigen
MRTLGIVTVLALVGGPALAASGDGNVLLGRNSLDENRLDDAGVGSATEFGVLFNLDFGWPVVLALDLLRSSGDAARNVPAAFPLSLATDVSTLDLHAGVRRFFRRDRPLRPYVGGGLAYTQLDVKQVESGSFGPGAEFSDVVVDDSDSSFGYWLDVGLLYRFNRFQIGGDVRYADASATLTPSGGSESLKLDSGGLHAGVFFGWSW